MIAIPFTGSKRNYVKQVEELVKRRGYKVIYEPFGGSGVLSVNLVNDGIVEKAVINDYDHLFDLYPSYLEIKDELIKDCLDAGFKKSKKKLSEEQRAFLQEKISRIDPKYYILLANNFVFSARQTSNVKVTDFNYFFNDITTTKQREYLEIVSRLERPSLDYRDFFKEYQDQFTADTLIILDPPYLNSAQKQYCNTTFFGLAETIELLKLAKESGVDFIFFNMVEKDTLALLNLFGFHIEELQVNNATLNYSAKRQDVLAYITQEKVSDSLNYSA